MQLFIADVKRYRQVIHFRRGTVKESYFFAMKTLI